MLAGEMVILMAIAVTRSSGYKLLTSATGKNDKYVSQLCESLTRSGSLQEARRQKYKLTPVGEKTIIEFLHQNEVRINDTIQSLQRLGVEKSGEIDKLAEEAVKVS